MIKRHRTHLGRTCGRFAAGAVACAALAAATPAALAIPSAEFDVHTADTVDWKESGAPALPWDDATADTYNHQHLTDDSFTVSTRWEINKVWDNRTLHRQADALNGRFGHGMIVDTDVRYGWGSNIPTAAKTAVESGFNQWIAAATDQFDLYADPWDRLGMRFRRVDFGPAEITIDFREGLQEDPTSEAYGVFFPAFGQILFETTPTVTIKVADAVNDRIRLAGQVAGQTSLVFDTPWNFTGNAAVTEYDFEYSDNAGTDWATLAPANFDGLTWNFGILAAFDKIKVDEMDFMTIALHEIGHAIYSGHTGSGTAGIMREDIAGQASFGSKMSIDDDSALAAAIAYTYSIPNPAAAAGGIVLMTGLLPGRRSWYHPARSTRVRRDAYKGKVLR